MVNLSTGTATDGFGSTDTLIDIEAVDGTRFGDHLIGDGLWNQLSGLDGDDTFDGNGSDVVGQGGFVDNLVGGAGNDTYVIDVGDEFAWINNVIDASLGETNTLAFGAGIDASHLSLFEIGGDLEITYAPGDVVRLVGWSGPDSALARQVGFSFGGGGSTAVVVSGPGTAGDDLIFGTTAVDTLDAGAGDDTVYAGNADDIIIGGSGAGDDTYDGGGDIDILTYESTTMGVTVDLGAGTAFGSEIGTDDLAAIENVAGGSGADTLTGDSGANKLLGLGGGDTLEGGGGADVLFGDTDPPAVPLTFTDTGLFPDVSELVDIGDLPAPGDGALGIVGDDLAVGDHAVATLTFAGGTAGYANFVGLYSVAADGTITDVSLAFEDVHAVDPGDAATVTLPGGPGSGFGLFLIVHGARLNSGYQGLDLETGTLAFIHDFGGPGERAAKITDSGADISLVFDDGETKTVLQGPVVHSTERGGSALLNADDTVHVAAGRLTAGNDTALRVGFEDMPGGGDSDFNDVIIDVGITFGEPGGADTLVGGSGDDTLTGGLGDDVFVFGAGGGTDRITDFEVGKDLFDLKDGVTISTITTVDADGDSFMDDTLVTLSDGAVELIGVTGVTGSDLTG